MDIHHLKIFLSVYRNRSFSKASSDLSLSQPTVSEHIKNLENELNCKLFDRVGRTVIPTKDAEAILPRASHISEELVKLRDDIASPEGTVQGPLLIGASTIPGTYILPAMASAFKKHHNVSFEIVIGDSRKITDMVLNHDILLGSVGARIEHHRIQYIPFIEDELILAASPGMVDADNISMKELSGLPFLIREEGSGTRKTFEKYLEVKNSSLHHFSIAGILGSTDSIKQAVKSGLGVSVISSIAVKEELAAGTIKEIHVKGMRIARTFYLIYHKKRSLPRSYIAFLEHIKGQSSSWAMQSQIK